MALLVVLLLIFLVFWWFNYRNKKSVTDSVFTDEAIVKNPVSSNPIIDSDILIDEEGREYKLVHKTIEIPRKTFLSGNFVGKFRTKINPHLKDEFLYEKYYDINIYEGEFYVEENGVGVNEHAYSAEYTLLPPNFLPKPLYCKIPGVEKYFEIELHEPFINSSESVIDRKLYQDDGDETFGTFNAQLRGYILDYIKEEVTERQYIQAPKPVAVQDVKITERTIIPTGNIDYSGNYSREEFWYSDRKQTYWGDWTYNQKINSRPINDEGCLDTFFIIIGFAIAAIFLIIILPQLGVVGLLFLIPLAIRLLAPVFKWVFQGIAALLLFLFVVGVFFGRGTRAPKPKLANNHPEEIKKNEYPIIDTVRNMPDTIISHYRVWEDYDGNEYQGSISVKKSDYINSGDYKNNLQIPLVDESSYSSVVYSLKQRDSVSLKGVYSLFDSIQNTSHIGKEQFAKIIVSFVQDIPYALILDGPCDKGRYQDDFIRCYLSSKDAICNGFQKFGINTPVEFMGNLLGDCDTRTLLLFTILTHYNYDVVMLSSEVYSHSLLGINLPFEGSSYNYNGRRYILWETTSFGLSPGIISRDISNMNNWEITLKSN